MLSEEQRAVYDGALANVRRGQAVTTIGGYAGTGKTVLASELARALPGFAVCAPSGKAAYVLRTKGVGRAKTVHSTIYYPPEEQPDRTLWWEKRPEVVLHWDAKEPEAASGVIVDESSMISRKIYEDLLSFGLPVVFVGDHGQLPPVGDDPGLMRDPEFRLETIHRNAGEIAHFGEHLRLGRRAADWGSVSGAGEKVSYAEAGEAARLVGELDAQAIAAFNATRVAVNRQYRADRLGRGNAWDVAPGERLIVLKNNRLHGVFNGQILKVMFAGPLQYAGDTPWRMMVAEDDSGRSRNFRCDMRCFDQPNHKDVVDPNAESLEYVQADYAYCVTCHKFQGSQHPVGVVIEQKCKHWDHTRWAYTAATRFSDSLYWVPAGRGKASDSKFL